MAERKKLSRRTFLRGAGLSGATISIGLPSFEAVLDSNGTAYAADGGPSQSLETRFVFWFNGNGIIEKYWIPRQDGEHYELTPCLQPLARFRDDFHVLSGVDNSAARSLGPGNGHHKSMSGLVFVRGILGAGRGWSFYRPGDRAADRSGQPVPFSADWRVPGIFWRKHPTQHELGWSRSPATSGNDPTSTL